MKHESSYCFIPGTAVLMMKPWPADGISRVQNTFRRFTMVEVILAVSVFTIGITAVLSVYIQSARALREARREIEMANVMKGIIALAELEVGTGAVLELGERRGTEQSDNVYYDWILSVKDGPAPGLRLVDVSVSRQGDEDWQAAAMYLPVPVDGEGSGL